MWSMLRRRMGDERGQGLAEYAWILVLVAAACAGTFTVLGNTIVDVLYEPAAKMFGG